MNDELETETREGRALLYRKASVEQPAMERAGKKSLRVCFSSETPVLRKEPNGARYREILDHSPENCDITLLQDGGAFLDEHSFERQVGSVERAWLDSDRKGRADLSFADTDLGKERWKLMKAGHRKDISFGYVQTRVISETKGADGIPIRRFAFQAYEISSTAVGADHFGTGVGRSINSPSTPHQKMQVQEHPTQTQNQVSTLAEEFIRDFSHLKSEILSAKVRALAEDIAPKDFSRAVMQLVQHTPSPKTLIPVADIGMTRSDMQKFSFQRAIRGFTENGKFGGFELECSQQVEKNSGQRGEGLLIPFEVVTGMSKRDFLSLQRDMTATTF
jgi:hypothetical protein